MKTITVTHRYHNDGQAPLGLQKRVLEAGAAAQCDDFILTDHIRCAAAAGTALDMVFRADCLLQDIVNRHLDIVPDGNPYRRNALCQGDRLPDVLFLDPVRIQRDHRMDLLE